MLLSRNDALNLDQESLLRFLSLRMPEGAQIDYKIALSGEGKNEAYKEFLKDITSFANANGGLLLLGVHEPFDEILPKDQIIGFEGGDALAKDLERVAATSTDPRIPSLLIKPVAVQNNKHVIVVHVPGSLIKPHMVNYSKHRSFYIRHSESSVPMTTHEIRDAVLSSATSEGRARSYALSQEAEALEYIIQNRPSFLLQAMPLLPLESPWDVLKDAVIKLVKGDNRSGKYKHDHLCLVGSSSPRPTINGIIGCKSRDSNSWFLEVHRNGFFQVIYSDIDKAHHDETKYVIHDGYVDLFRSFCDLCESIWIETQTDIPYLFRCKFFNATKTMFLINDRFARKFTEDYGRASIEWPEQFRQVGEPLEQIWRTWTEQLFHAFGLNWKVPA
jgi:hypothetical protein